MQSSKRPRTGSRSRSRSPYRRPSGLEQSQRSKQDREDEDRARRWEQYQRGLETNRKPRADQSVSARSTAPNVARPSESHAKTSSKQTSQDTQTLAGTVKADKCVGQAYAGAQTNFSTSLHAPKPEEPDIVASAQPVLDEAAQIEERRKRREALKNRYRGGATPVRIQALHLDGDANSSASGANTAQDDATTPGTLTDTSFVYPQLTSTASTEPTSPQTPKDASEPQSPADLEGVEDIEKTDEHIDPDAGGEDEPSAADYDPTLDMQEERQRHDKRLFNEESSSDQDRPRPFLRESAFGPESPVPSKKSKDAFDMFAEGDDEDDDMFAEVQKPAREPKTETKRATTLDVNMMDDWDDSDGYYNAIIGELIQGRYAVQQNLGRGMFASVIRAHDRELGRDVAIKIIRNNESMYKAGKKEIDILNVLAAADPDDKKHIIRLLASFDHKGHLCMVFENFSSNLRDLLKKYGRDVGINLKAVRAYASQLFLTLSSMKKCQYLHADLKPDNILVGPRPSLDVPENINTLKLCDLGTACSITDAVPAPYLVSRFYRAPELILGIPYDYSIDTWSVGCTLFELYTGKILFTGRNNNAMLHAFQTTLGRFPAKLLRRGSETYKYFDDLLQFQSLEPDKHTGRMVVKPVDVKAKPLRGLRERVLPRSKMLKMEENERKEIEMFLDLLEKCLDLRGDKRITPNEALKHPFVLRAK